jgi:putative hemolysin
MRCSLEYALFTAVTASFHTSSILRVMNIWLNILLIFVFQLLGAVFSCTEMTLVSLRGSQLEQLAQQDARGKRVAKVASNPNRFLSAVQIGTTFTGFLSASFGASALTPDIDPVLMSWGMPRSAANVVSTIVLTLIISYFSIVISELTPKRIAMQRTVQIARAVVPAVDAFATFCTPLIWLISKLTNLLVRLFGFDPNETESEVSDDELRVLVSSNAQIDKEERSILDDVFDASDTVVSEVMRPRADVEFLEASTPLSQAASEVQSKPYSRYPVIGEDFDHVLGFVHVRDILGASNPQGKTVADVMRPIMSLPGTSRILPCINLMRQRGMHLAIVIDEYGGTDGIVTLEDMIEELIGDIRDEYDVPEESRNDTSAKNGQRTVDGAMTIEDFADLTKIELPDGPYETVAGFFLAQTGTMPKVGDSYHSDDGYDMIVTSMEGRRIKTLSIHKRKPGAAETDKIVRQEQHDKQEKQKQQKQSKKSKQSKQHAPENTNGHASKNRQHSNAEKRR